jgi:hypothetical protein
MVTSEQKHVDKAVRGISVERHDHGVVDGSNEPSPDEYTEKGCPTPDIIVHGDDAGARHFVHERVNHSESVGLHVGNLYYGVKRRMFRPTVAEVL